MPRYLDPDKDLIIIAHERQSGYLVNLIQEKGLIHVQSKNFDPSLDWPDTILFDGKTFYWNGKLCSDNPNFSSKAEYKLKVNQKTGPKSESSKLFTTDLLSVVDNTYQTCNQIIEKYLLLENRLTNIDASYSWTNKVLNFMVKRGLISKARIKGEACGIVYFYKDDGGYGLL